MYSIQQAGKNEKQEKETIHSGHFMVSHFEAEEQDDEDNVAVPIPEGMESKTIVPVTIYSQGKLDVMDNKNNQQLAIDTSLSKLFQCMSLAYRQKLTSPKWNRFRGIRLRWKDKIRLNNVIWRCWHLQFIKKEHTLVCQFASPLDVDTHNKPEAIVLEGKYWKRKLAAVTAEYKRWRIFYRNHALGHMSKDSGDLNDTDLLVWDSNSSDNLNMMVDEDYMGLMSDTLFSTIANQPFAFPDSREIAKAGLADFIQPSLGPLQPNLDDYMDTFDPLQEFISSKLPPVPEEHSAQVVGWGYMENITPVSTSLQINPTTSSSSHLNQYQSQVETLQQEQNMSKNVSIQENRQSIVQTPYTSMLVSPVQQQPIDQYVLTSKSPNIKSHKSNSKINTSVQIYSTETATPLQVTARTTSSQSRAPKDEQFKQPQSSLDQNSSDEYKFVALTTPNIKFTSQQVQPNSYLMQNLLPSPSYYNSSADLKSNEQKTESRRQTTARGRGRSRSNTREPMKRPPLLSATSDPSLVTPATSVLLTQLLANNQDNKALFQCQTIGSRNNVISRITPKDDKGSVPILPQPPPAGTLITISSPITVNNVQQSADPLLLNTYSDSNSSNLDSSSQSLHSPTSSQDSIGSPNPEGSNRDRRVGHIHAEQKRRYNIKSGFDMIHSLIPQLSQNPNAKLSKAAMLQKGAEYIRQLRLERNQLQEEMDSLKQQIETLNTSISNCQSLLPATGAPVSRRGDGKIQEMFDEYVRTRTMENWKFWIFSLILRPLLNSFNNFVSTSSLDDLYSSTMLWIEQHCTLSDLRPVVLNSLKYLCTKTDILSEPEKLPEEARRLVQDSSS